MTQQETFTIEVAGAILRGTLDRPEPPGEEPAGSVMLCSGVPAQSAETEALFSETAETLVAAGLVVATFSAGSSTRPGARLAVESVDDASAVFRWLALRDEIDMERIGVLGYSLGAMTAAGLAGRTDRIARLCLLAPVAIEEVVSRLDSEKEQEVAGRLGAAEVPVGYFDGLETVEAADSLLKHEGPMLILHGAADRVIDPDASGAFYRAIEQAGRRPDRLLVALADHAFSGPARTGCLDQLAHFFGALSAAPAPVKG